MAEDVKRKISIFINDKEVKRSLGGIGREIGKIKRAIKESSDPTEIKRLNGELKKAQNHYGDLKEEIRDTNDVLDEAKGHFSTLLAGLATGNFQQVQVGLKGIASNIKGITKAGLAFIATPIGAAITLLTGVALATKQWIDFNNQVYEANKNIKDLTGETGNAVDAIRIRSQILKDTFEIDINESVKSAKSLVKSFGVSYDEAFDLIEQSAVRGKHKNEEFFDSIEEYPIQFKNAGYSAQEFIKIINTGADLSIYKDKLPDALKEADLAIREQTDSTKEALINAFGSAFTNELLKNVASGKITTKQALQEIAKESEKVNLNQQQQAQLTADLFKGAGEDAGGALKIFEAVNIALNEQQKPLTENQRLTQQQLDLNKELEGVYTALFASGNEGFNNWIKRGKIFATETLLKILKGGLDVYNWFVDLNNQSGTFSAILKTIGVSVTSSFSVVSEAVDLAFTQFKSLGKLIEGIFTFDTDKIQEAFATSFQGLGNTMSNLKTQAIADAKEIHQAFKGNNQLEHKSLDDFTASDTDSPSVPTTPNPTVNHIANEAFIKAEEELDRLIKQKRDERLIQQKEGLEREIAQIEQKYAALEEKYSEHKDRLAELEELKQQEIDDAKLAKQQEYIDLTNELEEENRILQEEARLEREAEKAETDEEKQLILLEKAQWVADQELKIELAKELAKVDAVEGAEELKAAIRKKYALKQKKLDAGFSKSKQGLQKQEVVWTELTEDQKLNLVRSGLGQAAELFNKNTAAYKAIKIAETTMTTYQAAMNAYNSLSVIPIIGPALGAVAAAAAVAVGVSNISKIANAKAEKMPTYYYGGFTGNKAMGYDEHGKLTGYVHEDEWVAPAIMTQNPKYANTFAYLESERKNAVGGNAFFNGGVTSRNPDVAFDTEAETTTESESITNTQLINALNRNSEVLEKIEANGIYAIFKDDLKFAKKTQEKIAEYNKLVQDNIA